MKQEKLQTKNIENKSNHNGLTLTKAEGTVNTQIHVPEASVVAHILVVGPLGEPQIRADLECLEHKVQDERGQR